MTELDTSPYLVILGPWRGVRIDTQMPESEFEPREGYEQDRTKYPL